MLRLPYGISNFRILVTKGYHYVDRTSFIARMEDLVDRYIFFLRPRRFGKSLFVSMLHYYYGLEFEDQFEELFGNFEIGQSPTKSANKYFVLKLDFSRVNTQSSESTFHGFLANVRYGVGQFFTNYSEYFDSDDIDYVFDASDPSDVINRLFLRFHRYRVQNKSDKQIYILIDEYDHFANELLAFSFDDFKNSLSRNGFVRKFYESIKTATGEGIVDRLFVTGVSPLTLDSLTSGFNISTNISLDQRFNDMMGFTSAEVEELLVGVGVDSASLPITMNDVRQWYNGYRFYHRAKHRLYNPDMVLFFAKEYASFGRYPDKLLDTNVASDYGKIRRIFGAAGEERQNVTVLNDLIINDEIAALMTEQFSFEKTFTRDDFVSLLFYMGIVTIKGTQLSRQIFEAPNYVIRQLYFNFFNGMILEQSNVAPDDIQLLDRVTDLAQNNHIVPLIQVVESILTNLSNRDAIGFDEKYVKAIFASLFYTTQIYTIHSEYETDRKYVDLLLIRRPPIEPTYQFAFELKYLKQADASQLENIAANGRTQLQEYLQHEKLQRIENLRAWLLVFVGTEARIIEEINIASD